MMRSAICPPSGPGILVVILTLNSWMSAVYEILGYFRGNLTLLESRLAPATLAYSAAPAHAPAAALGLRRSINPARNNNNLL